MKYDDNNPDRSSQYQLAHPSDALTVVNVKTGTRQQLLDQVNENFRQMRLLRTAVHDRDTVVATLHGEIHKRDEMIDTQNTHIKLLNRLRPLLYAGIGGGIAKLVEMGVVWLAVRHF